MDLKPEESQEQQILIVDDTPANIDVLDQFLEKEGYKISVAPSGESALDLAARIAPDLILLDVMMPGIDGFETCRRLQANIKTREIPIIFITAKNETEDIVKGFSLGGVDYITKPFRREEVCARIHLHLKMQRLMQALEAKNAKLAELNDLKNTFLGMASHDLRNPIAAIQGFSNLLLDHGKILPEETKKEFLQSIHKVSQDMLTLLEDLLNISIIESGKLNLHFQRSSLKQLVEERVRMYQVVADRKNITFHLDIGAVAEFDFDPNRISQVIDNLLTNAIKFSPSGKNIYISLEAKDNRAKFSVRDQGPGITAEDQDKLFKHFQKLKAKPTGNETSHGLGLAIAKRMVEAHKGQITVDSHSESGSTFSFEIPMEN
ncbi:MAG: hybrid sensor histidine kinase/response regulator [Nitrospinae bacterium]|jgi:two-component system, sensor histidine kinase and response regulator|nr:hybrid sensor histidine kinase/response regulator [Nitrospinota bacterium]MDA1109821.1 hybrid sensor histidine kinase/response regulator [Nitrospinota bacterium]